MDDSIGLSELARVEASVDDVVETSIGAVSTEVCVVVGEPEPAGLPIDDVVETSIGAVSTEACVVVGETEPAEGLVVVGEIVFCCAVDASVVVATVGVVVVSTTSTGVCVVVGEPEPPGACDAVSTGVRVVVGEIGPAGDCVVVGDVVLCCAVETPDITASVGVVVVTTSTAGVSVVVSESGLCFVEATVLVVVGEDTVLVVVDVEAAGVLFSGSDPAMGSSGFESGFTEPAGLEVGFAVGQGDSL